MQTVLMNAWALEANQSPVNQATATAVPSNDLAPVSLVLEPKVATEPTPKQMNSSNTNPKNLLKNKDWGKAGAASNTNSNSHRWWTWLGYTVLIVGGIIVGIYLTNPNGHNNESPVVVMNNFT